MYPKPRILNYDKHDPIKRWNLTERVFFACGACHILAYAFLESYDLKDAKAIWVRPYEGYTGNHVFIDMGDSVFDYHGYSNREVFIDHLFRRARHYWQNWNANLIELPKDVLISEEKSKTYKGLWLREPQQFLHDALPRAYNFLNKFPPPTLLAVSFPSRRRVTLSTRPHRQGNDRY